MPRYVAFLRGVSPSNCIALGMSGPPIQPPAYARVLPADAKVAEAQELTTLVDPRYPVNGVALLPDTSTASLPAA